MRQIVIFGLSTWIVLLSWCGIMTPQIDSSTWVNYSMLSFSWNIIPKDFSWTRDTVKWYAQDYYESELSWYVDKAKEWISDWVQTLKDKYNEGIDELWNAITENIWNAVSDKLNTIKF